MDVNHRLSLLARQLKIRQRNVMRRRKDQIHIERELAVETHLLMNMRVGGIEKEIECRRLMGAVANIAIEEEDRGEL